MKEGRHVRKEKEVDEVNLLNDPSIMSPDITTKHDRYTCDMMHAMQPASRKRVCRTNRAALYNEQQPAGNRWRKRAGGQ